MQLHKSINYSFLIVGHAKFGLDLCFGMIKKAYKVNFLSSLYEFADMVDASSTNGVNKAQLVGTHDGRIIVGLQLVFVSGELLHQTAKRKEVPPF